MRKDITWSVNESGQYNFVKIYRIRKKMKIKFQKNLQKQL